MIESPTSPYTQVRITPARDDIPDPVDLLPGQNYRDLLLMRGPESEKVIYYRRPSRDVHGNPIQQANWIIWGDSQASKRDLFYYKGYTPLPKYGIIRAGDEVPESQRPTLYDLYGPWGNILSHADGPMEFPADQVITFRWYRPEMLPRGLQRVRFPQLRGQEIHEYPCPECGGSRCFLESTHLARHLRVSHDYERHEVIAYGQSIGVDFSRVIHGSVREIIYDPSEDGPEVSEPLPIEDLGFEIQQITPASVAAGQGQAKKAGVTQRRRVTTRTSPLKKPRAKRP